MSKDTARQEVEQVCFAFEKAGKTGNKKDWGKFYDLEEPLIKKVEFANQPKLSIPKKIAEIADETWGYGDIDTLDIFGDVRLPDFENWWKSQEQPKDLIVAYLAGKALDVELVEVEG